MRFLEAGRTAAVILGASSWPNQTNLNGGESFRRSAEGMRNYLLDRSALNLSARFDILDLFDSDYSSQEQLERLSLFLRNWRRGSPDNVRLTGLVIYYVGRGHFSAATREFCILPRSSRLGNDLSNIPIRALADQLKNDAPFVRQLVILDCCFSGAAHRVWMDAQPAQFAARTVAQAMPANGTVLLCSSAETMPSMAPKGADKTMFTGALLHALDEGSPDFSGDLTPRNARDLAFRLMQEKWRDEAVRPVVHAVDRGNGDLSDFPVFHNPSTYVSKSVSRAASAKQSNGGSRDKRGSFRPYEFLMIQTTRSTTGARRILWRGGRWSHAIFSALVILVLFIWSLETRQYAKSFLPFEWQQCYIRDAETGNLDPSKPARQCTANRITYLKWTDKSDYPCTQLTERMCPKDRPNRSLVLQHVDDRGRLIWGESMLSYIEAGREVWSVPAANLDRAS